jgi:hypothetical protein
LDGVKVFRQVNILEGSNFDCVAFLGDNRPFIFKIPVTPIFWEHNTPLGINRLYFHFHGLSPITVSMNKLLKHKDFWVDQADLDSNLLIANQALAYPREDRETSI